jgi:hypothetical protein
MRFEMKCEKCKAVSPNKEWILCGLDRLPNSEYDVNMDWVQGWFACPKCNEIQRPDARFVQIFFDSVIMRILHDYNIDEDDAEFLNRHLDLTSN